MSRFIQFWVHNFLTRCQAFDCWSFIICIVNLLLCLAIRVGWLAGRLCMRMIEEHKIEYTSCVRLQSTKSMYFLIGQWVISEARFWRWSVHSVVDFLWIQVFLSCNMWSVYSTKAGFVLLWLLKLILQVVVNVWKTHASKYCVLK